MITKNTEWPLNLISLIFRFKSDETIKHYHEIMNESNTSIVESFIREVMYTLTDKEREVLYLRYREKKTLREVGELFQRGPERIRQIEAKALRKLRHPSRTKKLSIVYRSFDYDQFPEETIITLGLEDVVKLNAIYDMLRGPRNRYKLLPKEFILGYIAAIDRLIYKYDYSRRGDERLGSKYLQLFSLMNEAHNIVVNFELLELFETVYEMIRKDEKITRQLDIIHENIKAFGNFDGDSMCEYLTTDHHTIERIKETKTIILNPDGKIIDTMDEEEVEEHEPFSLLSMEIEDLDLSVRAFNCLKRGGINTVEDLVNLDEDRFMKIRNLGKRSFDEILEKLRSMGLDIKREEDQ